MVFVGLYNVISNVRLLTQEANSDYDNYQEISIFLPDLTYTIAIYIPVLVRFANLKTNTDMWLGYRSLPLTVHPMSMDETKAGIFQQPNLLHQPHFFKYKFNGMWSDASL